MTGRGAARYPEAGAGDGNPQAIAACAAFLRAPASSRYLFGATPCAAAIAATLPVAAIIDDHVDAQAWHGTPVRRSADLPPGALVVATLLGRPRTAARVLDRLQAHHCDYFTFHQHCGLPLPVARFWSGFTEAARAGLGRLAWVRDRMPEAASREILDRLVRFRLSADIRHLAVFDDRQHEQYFEAFLGLAPAGETFADVGAFDGYTTLQFVQRCPGYGGIHVFEPDPANLQRVRERLAGRDRIAIHGFGLSDQPASGGFSSRGSTSAVDDAGPLRVELRRLDDLALRQLSLLKLDVEGGEARALQGAAHTIRRLRPRLAVCVYHRPDDLVQIPELVLGLDDGYDIYLRHYTEGVTETVMFFLPR